MHRPMFQPPPMPFAPGGLSDDLVALIHYVKDFFSHGNSEARLAPMSDRKKKQYADRLERQRGCVRRDCQRQQRKQCPLGMAYMDVNRRPTRWPANNLCISGR